MPTLLCVPILVQTEHEALADAQAAKDAGADIVEFRIDEIYSGIDGEEKPILRLVAASPLPCIVTCRAASEGGHYDGDDTDRVSLYERLGTASGKGETPPRFIDVEFATYTRSANLKQKVNLAVDHPARPLQQRDLATSLILSAHDFQSRPTDLTRRVVAMAAEPACKVVKVAFRARSLRDNLELFEILAARAKPTIALAMGEFGLMSRVLAPKFHGFLTFAALRKEAATAPGQPTVDELLNLYRFRKITPRTRVYGVVGWPVGHSMSPLIHNAGFDAINHDGVYLPLPVPSAPTPEEGPSPTADDHYTIFKATLADLVDDPRLDLAGLSVTIPHKEHLLRFARERAGAGWTIDPLAQAVGAANTLAIDRDASGRVTAARVLNTDVAGVVEPLTEALSETWRGASRPPRNVLQGVDIAVVGAGGAARAAVFGLAAAGAKVTVHNRDLARAQALATELSAKAAAPIHAGTLAALATSKAHAFVNCTPIGMKGGPAPETSFIPVHEITQARNCKNLPLVFDAVYNPLRTPALVEAEKDAWKVVDGAGMFVRQATRQFEAWTGRSPPAGLFDRLVRERLASQA